MSETNISPKNVVDSPSTLEITSPPSSSSESPATQAKKKAAMMSAAMMENIRRTTTCVLSSGVRIDKDELKVKLTMPRYLRHAMRDCIRFRDPKATMNNGGEVEEAGEIVTPETPMVVFINTRSGGRHGPVLKERLKHLMSEEQVIGFIFF